MNNLLVIDDPDTIRMAREVADLTGETIPAALADLLREKLARCRPGVTASVWRAIGPHRPGPSAALLPRD